MCMRVDEWIDDDGIELKKKNSVACDRGFS